MLLCQLGTRFTISISSPIIFKTSFFLKSGNLSLGKARILVLYKVAGLKLVEQMVTLKLSFNALLQWYLNPIKTCLCCRSG